MIKHYDFTQFDASIDARVDDLLAQMTLDEKIGQMNQAGPGWKRDLEDDIRTGRVGTLLSFRNVAQINHFQRIAVEETRLGIPLITGNDVIHGYRTIFPIPLAESCTWDPELLERAARVAADEAAASSTDWIFAPMVDVARDPRWGRIAEDAGEVRSWARRWLARGCVASRPKGWRATDHSMSQALRRLWSRRSRQELQHRRYFRARAARRLPAAVQGRL